MQRKADGSPVTDVDRQVESTLRELIARESPGDAVVGEEFGGEAGAGRCWYLDPIDGTAAFCEGSDRWCTLVALAEGARVLLGVADFPVRRRRVWAGTGRGAFDAKTRMRVSTVERLSQATICDDYSHSVERKASGHPLVRLAAAGRAVRPHQGHSSLVVATGQAEVALSSTGGPWDYAPFVAIVAEAGGASSDLLGIPRFDGGTQLWTNGRVHHEALGVVQGAAHPGER